MFIAVGIWTVIAFALHKILPKLIFKNRAKFSHIFGEFLFQAIGYIFIPFISIFLMGGHCGPIEYVFWTVAKNNIEEIFTIKKIIYIFILCVISMPFLVIGLKFPKLKDEYPLWRGFSNASFISKILYELFYLFYYISWEFFFRGIWLLFILYYLNHSECTVEPPPIIYCKFSDIATFYLLNTLQAIIAGLFHYDKPRIEFILSFPVNFIFGYLAFKWQSILPCIIIHYFIGVTFDFLVSYVKPKIEN
jgi:hypothetical protein